MSMVEKGLGIAILPELILKRIPYHILTKPIDIPAYRDIGLAYRDRKLLSLAAEKFVSFCGNIDFSGIRALFLKPANDRVRCINKKILLQAVRDLQEICFINIKELAGSVELLSELRLLSCSLILVHKTL